MYILFIIIVAAIGIIVLDSGWNKYCQMQNEEWQEFCKWIETFPYSELITGKEKDNG